MYNTDPVSHRPAVIKVRDPQPYLRRDHEKKQRPVAIDLTPGLTILLDLVT